MANNWNDKIIAEFRTNQGRVGGPFEGGTLLLLIHRGAKSGMERTNPLAYQKIDRNTWAIFGSKGGAPTNPDWVYNLIANPDVEIEVGTERIAVRARLAEGAERERIWTEQKELMPGFADYEQRTDRQIPVIVLERR
jgi:deazaflavin-dependent oxidoreductase (nitroreductase family)